MRRNSIAALLGAGAIFVSAFTTPLMAGSFGIGFSGIGILAETNGTETLKSSSVKTTKKGVNGVGAVMAGYAQYTFGDDGFVVGLEKIPGEATLGSNSVSRTQLKTTAGVTEGVVQTAKAKISNHFGAFIETPSLGGFYLKVGYSEVDLTTQESLGTGASYGDATMDGTTIGVGFRGTSESGIHVKFAVERTDYGSVSLTSSAAASPDNATSTINADVETYGARLSIGYNF